MEQRYVIERRKQGEFNSFHIKALIDRLAGKDLTK